MIDTITYKENGTMKIRQLTDNDNLDEMAEEVIYELDSEKLMDMKWSGNRALEDFSLKDIYEYVESVQK